MGRTFIGKGSHRTFAPQMRGVGGGSGPTPTPPASNMMWWAHGYGGGIISAAGVVTTVLDWAGQHQDLNVTTAGKEPETGIITVDGLPTWSMGIGGTGKFIRRASTMLKPDTTPLVPTDVRTFWAVLSCTTSSVGFGFNITGGPVFSWQEASCFQPLFDLEGANAFYVFDNAWRFSGGQIQGPNTPAATWDQVPVIVTWIGASSPAGTPIKVFINGVLIATVPSGSLSLSGASVPGFVSGNCPNIGGGLNNACFQGGIAEQIAFLGDQSVDSPADFAATLAYLQATYPSA